MVSRGRWFILLGLITAAVMEVLDTTIVNVALPQMAGNLSATREEVAWVSTSYILANVVVLPMTAFFTETFGRKRYLTFSIILFVAASMLCGLSTSLGELVFWRLVQGAGGAALLSTAQATLRQVFPREQQGMVQSIFLLGVIVAPTLGPTLGGYITDNASWHWCFFINLPIGIVSALLVVTRFCTTFRARAASVAGRRLAGHRPARRRRRIAAVRARRRQHPRLVRKPPARRRWRSWRPSRSAF